MTDRAAAVVAGRTSAAFRFRVWDPAIQLMTLTRIVDHPPSLVLMQWTGLETQDGQPVFEGDIVRAWSEGSCATFEIMWRQGGAPMWILYPAVRNGQCWTLHGSHDLPANRFVDCVEILGNIYEHPEYKQSFESTKDVGRIHHNLMMASGEVSFRST